MASRSFPPQTDTERHHRSQTAKAMKKVAVRLACPACGRKMACKKQRVEIADGVIVVKTCRYCGYSRENLIRFN
jgi:C4-type Zn-finger protein